MSYARRRVGGSDVYVYDDGNFFRCESCSLLPGHTTFFCKTPLEMMLHLDEHRKVGHCIENKTFRLLLDEYLEHTKAV